MDDADTGRGGQGAGGRGEEGRSDEVWRGHFLFLGFLPTARRVVFYWCG